MDEYRTAPSCDLFMEPFDKTIEGCTKSERSLVTSRVSEPGILEGDICEKRMRRVLCLSYKNSRYGTMHCKLGEIRLKLRS